jgi:hypothetical protein
VHKDPFCAARNRPFRPSVTNGLTASENGAQAASGRSRAAIARRLGYRSGPVGTCRPAGALHLWLARRPARRAGFAPVPRGPIGLWSTIADAVGVTGRYQGRNIIDVTSSARTPVHAKPAPRHSQVVCMPFAQWPAVAQLIRGDRVVVEPGASRVVVVGEPCHGLAGTSRPRTASTFHVNEVTSGARPGFATAGVGCCQIAGEPDQVVLRPPPA